MSEIQKVDHPIVRFESKFFRRKNLLSPWFFFICSVGIYVGSRDDYDTNRLIMTGLAALLFLVGICRIFLGFPDEELVYQVHEGKLNVLVNNSLRRVIDLREITDVTRYSSREFLEFKEFNTKVLPLTTRLLILHTKEHRGGYPVAIKKRNHFLLLLEKANPGLKAAIKKLL